ncbi:MAG: ATP-binding cassette domain-containing protein [Mogibacterium sp.]|nr:ATP-binding cassette domain-containing protein [Mogibacterium sp.]
MIGGLDEVNSGNIIVDGDQITRKPASHIDTVRNAKIGYIFQNFNLLDDKTVFENVAIALRMVGIRDDKAIEQRVQYCLEKVGMYQYRKKRAGALSGGQRQRVAIARAIVKNPKIIIADEPTGNLDSANTLEIMNIIKTISKERLVILVTHERNIAEFYSDHVAEMSDGKIIKAYDNDSSRYLDYQLENKIYLQDMPVQKQFANEEMSVRLYSDEERQADIKLVIKGGNLYIDTGGKLNVVDETANIELVDDHYKAMDETVFDSNSFEYDVYLPEDFRAKYTSIYKFSNMIGKGWETVKGFKRIRKILLLGFVFAAMFAFLAISNVFGIFDVQPEDYLTTSADYVTVSNPQRNDKLMKLVASLDGVDYVIPGTTLKTLIMPLDDYLQTAYASADLNVSIAMTSSLKAEDLIYGTLPQGDHDIILDKMVADEFFRENGGADVGLTQVEQMVGRRITIDNLKDYTITGVSDRRSPVLYVDESQMMYILTNTRDRTAELSFGDDEENNPVITGDIKDIAITDSKIKVTSGSKPEKPYEVIVSEAHKDEFAIGKILKTKMAGHKLKVVGFYSSDRYGENTLYVNARTIELDYISRQKNFTACTDNVKMLSYMLEKEGIACKINTERDKQAYIDRMKDSLTASLLVAGIILLISLIEMFLMLRSSFLSRIKEVGTLRAIGLKKRDIYRMFIGEILVITFVTGIPGVALMYYIMYNVVKITAYFSGMYMVKPFIALIAFAVILLFNLLVGLLPVARTLRKTPAEILARTDI